MFAYGKGICYSGYRMGQSPIESVFPTFEEVLEDLRILEEDYDYIRLYDLTEMTYKVLEVLKNEEIDLKVLMGIYLLAEVSHQNHTMFGIISESVLEQNKSINNDSIQEGIRLIKEYQEYIIGVSIANESRSYWNVNRVSIESLIKYASMMKERLSVPVTYCEETIHWLEELSDLAEVVDFISFHTYPSWNDTPIEEAITYIDEAYKELKKKYPNKPLVITETGWATKSHGGKMPSEWASIMNQSKFIKIINEWSESHKLVVFIFEAFDELWKGGNDPNEPEKNWGIYDVDRQKKA